MTDSLRAPGIWAVEKMVREAEAEIAERDERLRNLREDRRLLAAKAAVQAAKAREAYLSLIRRFAQEVGFSPGDLVRLLHAEDPSFERDVSYAAVESPWWRYVALVGKEEGR